MNWNLRNLDLPQLRSNNRLSDEQRRILMISGIVIGAAALLTYPAILLYRRYKNRSAETDHFEEDHAAKSFAPSYRSKQPKTHNRKAETNGHVQQAH